MNKGRSPRFWTWTALLSGLLATAGLLLALRSRVSSSIPPASSTPLPSLRPTPAPTPTPDLTQLLRAWAAAPENATAMLPTLEALAETPGPQAPLYQGLAQAFRRTQNLPEGYRLVEAGRALARAGRWEEAFWLWQQAVQREPENPAALVYYGLGLARKGAFTQAQRVWKQARRLAPADPLPAYLLGLLALHQNQPAEASAWLWRAVALAPSQPLFRYALAQSLARQPGFFPQAWQVMENAVRLAPQDPQAYHLAAGFALEHRVYLEDRVLPWLRRLLQRHPDDATGWVLLGRVYLELGQPALARRFLQKAQALDPTSPDLHRAWALYYRMQNQPQAAQRHLDLARQYTPPGLWPTVVP